MTFSPKRRPAIQDAAVLLAAIASFLVLLWLGRGLTFFADEWAVIGDRPIGVDTFLRPFNEHWLGVTTLVYRAMVDTIGLGSYVPYLALLASLHVVVVVEVYAIARRSTSPGLAAGVAVLVAFFGSGFENLFWAMQIGFIGAIALGLAALLLLDGTPSRRRVGLAVVLLTLGVMTSGFGLFMMALVGLDLVLDPSRRRIVPALALPTTVYGVWYLLLGRQGVATYGDPFTAANLLAIPRFVLDGAAEAFSSALGIGRVGGMVVLAVFAIVLAAQGIRRRAIQPRALACFGAIVAMYAILGIVRAQIETDATYYSRYSYLSGILALLGLAALLGRSQVRLEGRRQRLVGAGLLLVFVLSLAWNVRLLVAGRELFAQRADLTRAMVELGLSIPLPDGVDPNLSLVLVPSPVRLHDVVARFGSPLADGLASDAVPPISDGARTEALRRAKNPPDWLLAQPWLP